MEELYVKIFYDKRSLIDYLKDHINMIKILQVY